MKTCGGCKTNKAFDSFHPRADGPGYRSICKICWRAESNQRYVKSTRPKLIEEERALGRKRASSKFRQKLEAKAAHADYQARRRAKKLQATPKWLTEYQKGHIKAFYELCTALTETQPEKPLSVDHIIPLQGENVSGLHVPWNLQIITVSENSRKSNRLDYEIQS